MAAPETIQWDEVKKDFPLLQQNPQLAYLDSAATSQRPSACIQALTEFYTHLNANPLRGMYELSGKATVATENARKVFASHIGCRDPRQIIFSKNASESLNLVAESLGHLVLEKGDNICVSIAEHHSNFLPWKKVAQETGAEIRWIYPDAEGEILPSAITNIADEHTKIVAVTALSNVLGTKQDVKGLCAAAHEKGAYIVIDACQAAPHMKIDVKDMDCDFLAFSAHKFGGPMGVGTLWGKTELLEQMDPFLVGGEMIESVSTTDVTWAPIPYKFEAGTQNAAGIYSSGKTLEYLEQLSFEAIEGREAKIMDYLIARLEELDFIEIIGTHDPNKRIAVVSFNVKGIHPHDVASLLDTKQVAIRAGKHCAEPLLTWLGIQSCCRASISFYNTFDDVDQLIDGLKFVWSVFNG